MLQVGTAHRNVALIDDGGGGPGPLILNRSGDDADYDRVYILATNTRIIDLNLGLSICIIILIF